MKLLIAMLGMLLVAPTVLAATNDAASSNGAVVQLAQNDQGGDPTPPKDIDINVQVGQQHDAGSTAGAWWTEPIWIAVFVIGGVVLLTLLVVAAKGSSSPATIVKG